MISLVEREYKKLRDTETLPYNRDDSIADIERKVIKRRCDRMRPVCSWREIAESLGIDKRTLFNKRKEYDILNPDDENYDSTWANSWRYRDDKSKT